jgi:hypothetical protein
MNKIKKNEEISVTNGSVEIVRREVQEGYPRSQRGLTQRVLPNGIFCQEVMLPNEVLPKGVLPKGVLPKASFTKKDSSYINELR